MADDEPLDVMDLCKGHAMTAEQRRARRLADEYPYGWYLDPRAVYGSPATERKPWFMRIPFLWLASIGLRLREKQVDHVLGPICDDPDNDDYG